MRKRREITSLHEFLRLVEGPPTPSQHEMYVYWLAANGRFRDASVLAERLGAHYESQIDGYSHTALAFSMRCNGMAHVLEGAHRSRRRAA